MPANGVTRANKIRQERRDSLRELLRHQKHEEHVVDLIGKLESLDGDLDNIQVQRLSKAIDTRMKLIAKYLPEDKEPTDLNLGGQEDNPVNFNTVTLKGVYASRDTDTE